MPTQWDLFMTMNTIINKLSPPFVIPVGRRIFTRTSNLTLYLTWLRQHQKLYGQLPKLTKTYKEFLRKKPVSPMYRQARRTIQRRDKFSKLLQDLNEHGKIRVAYKYNYEKLEKQLKIIQDDSLKLIEFWQHNKRKLMLPYLLVNQTLDKYPANIRLVTIKRELSKLPIALRVAFWTLYAQHGYQFQLKDEAEIKEMNHCETTSKTVVEVLTSAHADIFIFIPPYRESCLDSPGLYKLRFQSQSDSHVHYCCVLVERSRDQYLYWCIDSDLSDYTFPMKVAFGSNDYLLVPREIMVNMLKGTHDDYKLDVMRFFGCDPSVSLTYHPAIIQKYELKDMGGLEAKLEEQTALYRRQLHPRLRL